MSIKDNETVFLELGQIIQINAEENEKLNEKIFIIDYLDDEKLDLIQQDTLSKISLNIQDGDLADETIESIIILENPLEKGYARQNDLIPNNWVSIYFEGDLPMVINAQITDIEEDQIELTTHPDKDVLYIDFEYKGIPKNLNIFSIQLKEKPKTKEDLENKVSLETTEDTLRDFSVDDDLDEKDEDLELDLDMDLDTEEQIENIKDAFLDVEDIVIEEDEDLGEITEQVHVSEKEKRYSVEIQTSDLLDELLASIPSNERTQDKLNKIHIVIERFKQLRKTFSKFDEEGNAEKILKKGANYKPLLENFKSFEKNLEWMIPVVRTKKNLYDKEAILDEDVDENINILPVDFGVNDEFQLIYQYLKNDIPDGENKYDFLYRNLNSYFQPQIEPSDLTNIIKQLKVNGNFNVLLDNIADFYSSTMSSDKSLNVGINQNRFIMQRLTKGLTRLVNLDPENKKAKLYLENLTPNDELFLKGFLMLPKQIVNYSKIKLPSNKIFKKSNLNLSFFSYFKVLNDLTNIKKKVITENKDDKIFSDFNKPYYFKFEELRRYEDRQEDEDVYDKFLNSFIPKTKDLFKIVKKNIKSGVSFYKIIEQLEPYLIYSSDITFKQYNDIMQFAYEEIEKIKKTLVVNKSKYSNYLSSLENYESFSILENLLEKVNINSRIDLKDGISSIFSREGYNFNEDMYTDTSIKKINDIDCAKTYLTALAFEQLKFAQPIDLDESIKEEIDSIQDASRMDPQKSNDCEPITLAKKYNDIEDIERDSRNTEIFFDRKYDDTMYDIGRSWKEENSVPGEAEDELIQRLSDFLIKNNGVTKEKAERDAMSMILGSKMVQNGDYAILDLGDLDYKYYVRDNDKWKLDKSLDGKSLDEINFCNLKDNCIKIKKQCVNLDESKQMFQ